MINRKWFDPRGSMEAFAKKYRINNGVMSLRERIEGIYRFVTGRLDSPAYIDDNDTYKLSKNHAGLFDYLTLGIFNAIESFLRGNWIQTQSTHKIFSTITAIVWLPLNLLRAAVGAVAVMLAFIPAFIYHRQQVNSATTRAIAEEALKRETIDSIKRESAKAEAEAPTEEEVVKSSKGILMRFKKGDAVPESREGTVKVVLKAIEKASDFAELENHASNTATSFWKNDGQEKDGTYIFRLRNTDGNDPVLNINRYHAVYSSTRDVGLFKKRAQAALGNDKKGVTNTTKLGEPTAAGDMLVTTPIKGKTNAKANVYVPARMR